MLLVRQGTGKWDQMQKEMVAKLIEKATGGTFEEFTKRKRAFEFELKGSKGYRQDGRLGQVYPRGYQINVDFGIRLDGVNYRIAYASSVEEERHDGVVRQVLKSENGNASPKNLKLMFERKKTVVIPADEWERALYFILYFDCEQSPFHKKDTPGAYFFKKHEENARKAIALQKEKLEISNKILSEIDLFTLKSYAQSIGVLDVEYMEEDEVRMKVLQDAMRDTELFKTRLQTSTFNLSGDVYRFYDNGILKLQIVGDKDAWSYGKGSQKGEIITLLPRESTDNQLRGITAYLFDNPSTFDKIRALYFETGGDEQDLESSGVTLAQSHSFNKVEELISKGILTHSIPKSAVYGVIDGKKEVVLTNVKGNNWKESISKYLDENPHLLEELDS